MNFSRPEDLMSWQSGHARQGSSTRVPDRCKQCQRFVVDGKSKSKRMGDLRTLSSTHEHDQSHRFIPCGATLRADLGLVAKGDG
jgi:hypothetical protein